MSVGLYSQCDSLNTEVINDKITINFLSEKIEECDIQTEKLKCQLQSIRTEVIKQKTLKWVAIAFGTYISIMTVFILKEK